MKEGLNAQDIQWMEPEWNGVPLTALLFVACLYFISSAYSLLAPLLSLGTNLVLIMPFSPIIIMISVLKLRSHLNYGRPSCVMFILSEVLHAYVKIMF